MNLIRALKIGGAVVVGVVVLTLLTLRLTGFEPEYLNSRGEEFLAYRRTIYPFGARLNWIARPGLWLKGEVVREPIKDWAAIQAAHREGKPQGKETSCQLEVRTPYFIRHSITMGCGRVKDGKIYIQGHTDPSRMGIPFPYDKAWTRHVARDPRVRLKVGNKIYEFIAITVTDRAEAASVFGRDPVVTQKGPDGKEFVEGIYHFWRLVQMNVPDYSAGFQGVQQVAENN